MNKEITGEKLREIAKQYDKTLIDDDAPAPYVEGVTAKTQKIVECYLTNIFNLHPPGIVILGEKAISSRPT